MQIIVGTIGFRDSVGAALEEITNTLERHSSAHEKLDEGFDVLRTKSDDILTASQNVVNEVSNGIDGAVADLKTKTLEILDDHQKTNQDMLQQVRSSLEQSINDGAESMTQSITQLDEAIQREIEQTIRVMAENLTGITQQFVTDYEPLTQRMRELMETGSRN